LAIPTTTSSPSTPSGSPTRKAAEAKGDSAYFDGILDKLNFDICLANRAFMARISIRSAFTGSFSGFLFYPFDNRDQKASTPDMGVLYAAAGKNAHSLQEADEHVRPPAVLTDYEDFVRRTMEDNQKRGGVAVKFEAAYFRSL